ncbi:MAG: CFI-box-CTERM domain-containing protein [Candidatus Pacearchaeota archaeon]|jgi:hypothetical protein
MVYGHGVCERCGDEYNIYDEAFNGSNHYYCPRCANYRIDAVKSAQERSQLYKTTENRSCPNCNGEGRIGNSRNKCILCSGRGEIEYENIPPLELPEDFSKEEEKKGRCYITSACVNSRGLSDECLELKTLRNFRDNYLKKIEGGKEDIDAYYRTAPKIVRQIDQRPDKLEIYNMIYERDISLAINMINNGDNDGAYRYYKSMVQRLEDLTKN